MSRHSQAKLADRVAKAAEAALAAQDFAGPVDILLGIGWIDFGTVQRWRRGEIECLEQAVQTAPAWMAEARRLLRAWAAERGLAPSPTDYIARTPQRQALRFTRSGNPAIEEEYRHIGFRARSPRRSANSSPRNQAALRTWWSCCPSRTIGNATDAAAPAIS
jgi:hypothetical protein